MQLFNQVMNYDKENKILTFNISVKDTIVAKFIYTLGKGYSVEGDLKSIYGFKDNEKDNEKYLNILNAYEWLAHQLILKNSQE